jgi:hypothetical protein
VVLSWIVPLEKEILDGDRVQCEVGGAKDMGRGVVNGSAHES